MVREITIRYELKNPCPCEICTVGYPDLSGPYYDENNRLLQNIVIGERQSNCLIFKKWRERKRY